MKRCFTNVAIRLSLVCWYLAGCANPNNISEIPISESTLMSLAPGSVAPVITETASATLQPTRTSAPSTFQLVLPAITMSPQESENALLELLRTNGNCTGKCIAGIWPDEMTMREAMGVMAHWGMLRISDNSDGNTYVSLVQIPLYDSVVVDLFARTSKGNSEVIDRIQIWIQGTPDRYLDEDLWLANRSAWSGFKLDTLLKTYGVPSYVGFDFSTMKKPESGSLPEGRTILYTLEIQYEKFNLAILREALAYYDGKNVFLCPSKDPHHFIIEINPSRPLIKRQEIFSVTWQEITDTDLDAYYQMFTDESNPDVCVTLTLEQIQTLQPYFH